MLVYHILIETKIETSYHNTSFGGVVNEKNSNDNYGNIIVNLAVIQ